VAFGLLAFMTELGPEAIVPPGLLALVAQLVAVVVEKAVLVIVLGCGLTGGSPFGS
jgi:hypothetical protein